MATLPRQGESAPTLIFRQEPARSAGFLSELITLLTHPVRFFTHATSKQFARHTLFVAVIVLGLLVVQSLQTPAASGGTAMPPDFGMGAPPDMGGMPPFDGGMPPVIDGGGAAGSGGANVADNWMTALTVIGTQLFQWGVLALLLSEVTMFNGHRPRLTSNLQIVIWASVPTAIMTALQLAFVAGGGTVSAGGFSGFLAEWDAYHTMDIHLKSLIHAFTAQITLFWVWSLVLVYVGARTFLKGKRFASVLVIVTWVIMLTVAHSFQSYETLAKDAMNAQDPMLEQPMPGGEFPYDEMPQGEMPQGEIPPDAVPQGEIPPDAVPQDAVPPQSEPQTEVEPVLDGEGDPSRPVEAVEPALEGF